MKKSVIAILLALTLGFAGFVAGLYLGRNYNHASIQISGVSDFPLPTATGGSTAATISVPATLDELTQRIMDAINTATQEQWMEISGIGPETAKNILQYRQDYGDFKTPDDLDRVKGIGPKTIESIMDHFRRRLTNENSGS